MFKLRNIFPVLFFLAFCANVMGEGQYHLSASHRQIFSKPSDDTRELNHFGGFQTYIGVSGFDEFGYGNFEIGYDWLANYSLSRFTIAFGQVVTFGPEIHGQYDNINQEWGWGIGPSINFTTRHFTLTMGYPFDFNTCLYEKGKDETPFECPEGMVSGLEFVLRGQLPAGNSGSKK